MDIINDISWRIENCPDVAELYCIDDYPRKITGDEWEKVVFEDGVNKLRLPTHRFCQEYEYITFYGKTKVEEIINKIYDFYQSEIDENKIFNYQEDCLGFIEWAKDEISKGNVPTWIEIMGDKKFFEGLLKIKDNVWQMQLGS